MSDESQDEKTRQREALLNEVWAERITPEEAEQKARELGLAPLARERPDPTQLGALLSPGVTPYDKPLDGEMLFGDVVIWIATRGVPTPSAEVAKRLDQSRDELVGSLAREGKNNLEARAEPTGKNSQPVPVGVWQSLQNALTSTVAGLPFEPYLRWLPDDPNGSDNVVRDAEGTRWRYLKLQKEDIRRLWPVTESLSDLRKPNRGGRPPAWEWDTIRKHVDHELQYHGAPSAHDPEWSSNAAVVKSAMKFCREQWDQEPAESTMRAHVTKWVREYRAESPQSSRDAEN